VIWRAPREEPKSFKQHAFGMDDVDYRIIQTGLVYPSKSGLLLASAEEIIGNH
jgi:hypothetical protein